MRSRMCSRDRARSARRRSPSVVPTERVDGRDAPTAHGPTTARSCSSDWGDEVTVQAGEEGIRFLLVSGKPLRSRSRGYGPIVMNTQAELRRAARELRDGTFIKSG